MNHPDAERRGIYEIFYHKPKSGSGCPSYLHKIHLSIMLIPIRFLALYLRYACGTFLPISLHLLLIFAKGFISPIPPQLVMGENTYLYTHVYYH